VVEVRLKSFQFLAFPDKHFKFSGPMTIYISRAESYKKFVTKFKRVLAHYANNVVKTIK